MTLSIDIARIDSAEMAPDVVDEIRAIAARATEVDGTAPLSEQALKSVGSGDDTTHLVATAGSRVVGYAGTAPGSPTMTEIVVDPEFRTRGIGTQLIDRSFADGGAGARIWAHGNIDAARALASTLGLSVARELLQLRRPLAEPALPDVTVPDNVSLRTYRGHQDDAELLRVNNAAFSWHPEQGGWTEKDIAERRDEAWFDPAGVFLAFEEGTDTLLGFHWTKVHPAEAGEDEIGEVYVVGIDPEAQGRGLGRVLTLAGLHYLRGRDLRDVLLYVESDNAAAVHTYERLGFTRFHTDVAYARP
ncbi:GNAT family N-acetyltransferase [Rhodococcus sp. 06-156-3C]|uniref:mycothiol synthase n=1 Tax=Nocardiaceae TaxID=85025 RepID=UPI0003669007|nr:GNAT family N-acetyltransferase [Rhodococcus sp. 06-156-4C]OZD23577.1 GNAT family N-acetyltransferase [Rhodococcus sp. 06-156-4a]OZD26998.1 GNAT family N-acetyltransferase [Rhodococcus sp. 06-156-3C]OZD29539.1 GNAT family N-acetyltransferase [Rhodococcus sp. 06-156-3b]OZD31604.1 GNAT family N-acetyltransferase [Rhodococcus sp. 06-156-3]OZD66265.1 GNAT family N-acetyltransferase [Rhodococcus sp. 06-1059B-a]OZF59173.1 GNAT family N-acetyltransferase [Rhodococcus sp. 06-156-4]